LKNIPRIALAGIILLVALVFFGSVACPPLGERNATNQDGPRYPLPADPGTTKPLPGPLQIEDVFKRVKVEPPASFLGLTVTVHAADGLPLEAAQVLCWPAEANREKALIDGRTDAQGNYTVKWLPEGAYQLEASARGFFTAEPLQVLIPSPVAQHFDFALKIGARISGELRRPGGTPIRYGVVRFTNSEEQLEVVVRPNAEGNFDSGPLLGGLWVVEWLPHTQGAADPRLRFDAAIAPGGQRRFIFTLTQTNSAKDPAIGVAELFE
jgi:hypothetical protein